MAASGTTIGFVGAGRLGGPMVERLLAAGHTVHLFARRAEVRIRCAALGARVFDDVRAAVAEADVVLICVYSDAQFCEVALGLVDAMPRGAVLASHVTGDPASLTAVIEAARPHGVEVLDAPVSGTADDIRAGRLTIMLGGSGSSADRVASVLGAYASTIVRTGPPTSALCAKLLNNLVYTANVQVLLAAVAAGEALGVSAETLVAAFAAGSARSAAVEGLRVSVSADAFAERVGPFLRKDLATACATRTGTDLSALRTAARTGPLDLRSHTGPT